MCTPRGVGGGSPPCSAPHPAPPRPRRSCAGSWACRGRGAPWARRPGGPAPGPSIPLASIAPAIRAGWARATCPASPRARTRRCGQGAACVTHKGGGAGKTGRLRAVCPLPPAGLPAPPFCCPRMLLQDVGVKCGAPPGAPRQPCRAVFVLRCMVVKCLTQSSRTKVGSCPLCCSASAARQRRDHQRAVWTPGGELTAAAAQGHGAC